MDLLKEDSELDLDNKKWRIYTNNSHFPPQFICGSATVKNSIVNDGCKILGGGIEKSILFRDVKFRKDSGCHPIDFTFWCKSRKKVHIRESNRYGKHNYTRWYTYCCGI